MVFAGLRFGISVRRWSVSRHNPGMAEPAVTATPSALRSNGSQEIMKFTCLSARIGRSRQHFQFLDSRRPPHSLPLPQRRIRPLRPLLLHLHPHSPPLLLPHRLSHHRDFKFYSKGILGDAMLFKTIAKCAIDVECLPKVNHFTRSRLEIASPAARNDNILLVDRN